MRVHQWLVLVSVFLGGSAIDAAAEPNVVDTHRPDIAANMRVAVHV